MPHDSSSNAPSSGQTSTSAPTNPRSERATDAARKEASELGESQFLTKQAADAKAAISRVLDDIKNDLAQGIDPRAWMQVHPWATLGVAAIAGFAAATVAVPSQEEQTLKRLKKIEEALTPKRPVPMSDAEADGNGVRRAEQGGGFLAGLAGQVLRAVQPVLMSAITAGITAKTVKEGPPTGGDNPTPATHGADPNI